MPSLCKPIAAAALCWWMMSGVVLGQGTTVSGPDYSKLKIQDLEAQICTQQRLLQLTKESNVALGPVAAPMLAGRTAKPMRQAETNIAAMLSNYQQRTGEGFNSQLMCRSVQVSPDSDEDTLANIQNKICTNRTLRASNQAMVERLKRTPGMATQAKSLEAQLDFKTLDAENALLTKVFTKEAGKPPNLAGCSGEK
jgi:hypothetical protein